MNDRQLLELAAKAAGLIATKDCNGADAFTTGMGSGCFQWNPLTDDGDALRLAVKRRFTVKIADHEVEVFDDVSGDCLASIGMFQSTEEQVSATARRAIVRAAAEIGRAMP